MIVVLVLFFDSVDEMEEFKPPCPHCKLHLHLSLSLASLRAALDRNDARLGIDVKRRSEAGVSSLLDFITELNFEVGED